MEIIEEVKLAKNKIRDTDDCTGIVLTSGPYTTQDGLTFSPLEKFLNRMEDQQPDILVMHGPFLPENHKLVELGRFEVNGNMLTIHDFYCEIWKMIVNSLPNARVVIIPSIKDVL